MINDIIIIDDFISETYQDKIAQETLYNPDFPWYFAASITKKIPLDQKMEHDSHGFGHMFYKKQTGSISAITNLLIPLRYQACDKINFKFNELYWGRVFLTFPNVQDIFQKKYNLLHVDADIPHLVCLYYVNDADGDTVITTNATYPQFSQDEVNSLIPPAQITHRVTPKKGRVVLFDGKFYHASTNPTKDRRCIVNFDII